MSEAGMEKADFSGLPEEGLVVVGFSGGPDSTALAHLLLEKIQRERILLAHVNHMLRGEEAQRDEAAAQAFAGRYGLRFAVLRKDIQAMAEQEGLGLEECGRRVRYDFFASLAPGENDRILTAHNGDDNVETILFNLCRGTSLRGLCGIPPRRGKILRPLLSVSREEIQAYCRANGLSFVTDSSNACEDFARNRIRRRVVPLLKDFNPRLVDSVAQTAGLLREDRAFLAGEEQALLAQAKTRYGLGVKTLLDAPLSLRSGAVKAYLESAGCENLEKVHVDLALGLLERGGGVSLPGGIYARCSQGVFFAGRKTETQGFSQPVVLGENLLPNGKKLVLKGMLRKKSLEESPKIHNLLFKNSLDYDIITGTLVARSRREGDRFAPMGRKVTKSMKSLFQENRIPVGAREETVLLECGGRLVFCEGVGPAEGFGVTANTRRVLLVEIAEEKENG